MFASQLIYTGCGKDKTGAFSVWSKSLDITKTEENEIRDKMLYKRPSNLPFEPTPEELENLFPKKLGFFRLTSGRMCLAQSVYIGNVYSDLDKRTGNYIIHAFVFDKDEDLIPMNFIGSDVFRRGLTYEEWHDHDAPDELPKVEIVDRPSTLTKQEIDTFFDATRTDRLKLLLQAIINSSTTDQKVTFYDKHSNLKYWYKAISACLPKGMLKELTFNTFFTPSTPLPSQMQAGAINTDVKIRNIAPTVASTLFNYQQDARAGKYSFDFESGILPGSITVSNYVDAIVDTLKSNVFQAISLVDAIGKIRAKSNTDMDTAMELHFLFSKQISKIDSVPKLSQLLRLTADYYKERLPEVADTLYTYGLQSGHWALNSAIAEIYRFIFDYSEVADKSAMIRQYIANQSAFGVNANAPCNDYCASFKSNAPFAWINFLDYIFEGDNFQRYLSEHGSTFNGRYLLFNTFAESMTELAESQENKKAAMRYFVETAMACIQKEQMNDLLALLSSVGKCGPKWKSWLLKTAFAMLTKEEKGLLDVCRPIFLFTLAESCGDSIAATELITQMIAENEKNNDFIKLYVERYDQNASFYSGIYKELSADAKYATFLNNVELYKFANSPSISRSQLQNYYDKYVVTGRDNGLFPKKLQQYLAGCNGKSCIVESLNCYDAWMKESVLDAKTTEYCVETICNTFFSAPFDALREYISQRSTAKIKEMLERLKDTGYRIPNQYYVITFGEYVKRLTDEILRDKRKSPYVQETLDKLNDGKFYKLPPDDTSRDLFIKTYLPDLIQLYLAIADEKTFEAAYCQTFKPFHTCPGFAQMLYVEMNRLNPKDHEVFFNDTIVCACCGTDRFNQYLMRMVEKILEDLGRSKRKKLLADLVATVPAPYQKPVKAFADQYQKAHEGLFGKLFGGMGKKDEDKSEKDSKKDKEVPKEEEKPKEASDEKPRRPWKK
ncbi:MAG: hypothetical protein J6D21_08900 [Clostridia bacterium]|nr:hypothetical protein [Clostridia bacterium]